MPTPVPRPPPLAGIRILDLTRLLPGPMCTLHLADLGADVIKIEDPRGGDYGRTLGRVKTANSALFLAVNRNKRALTLDLKQSAGREVFLRLAQQADAVVEGFRPGVVDRLGIGYRRVSAINPRIVYCSITGYGQNGPYRDRAGHDLNYCAQAGLTDQIGDAGGDPVIPNFQVADLLGGAATAAMGILAALLDARQSGRGRYLDVAMADAVLAHAVLPLATFMEQGATRPRGDDLLSGRYPCYQIYRTGDGRHMAVAALERKFWDSFCEIMGRPDLKPLHLTEGEAAERAKREIAAIFSSRPSADWCGVFARTDCCVTPVLTLEEALRDPQYAARGMVVESLHPVDGPVTQFALPLKISEFQFAVRRPAPMPDEHGEEILREAGFDDDDIVALKAGGAVGATP